MATYDSKFFEVELMLSSYFYQHLVPVLNSSISKVENEHISQKEKDLGHTIFGPDDITAFIEAKNYSESRETLDEILIDFQNHLKTDGKLKGDIEKMIEEFQSAATKKVGKEEYDKISNCIGGDLARKYITGRLDQLVIDKFASWQMPRSLAEYVFQTLNKDSLFNFVGLGWLDSTPLEKEVEKSSENKYNPSLDEKMAGALARVAFDGVSVSPLNLVGMAGSAVIDLLSELGTVTFNNASKRVSTLFSKDKVYSPDEIVSTLLFDDENALSSIRKTATMEASSLNVSSLNKQLNNKVSQFKLQLYDFSNFKFLGEDYFDGKEVLKPQAKPLDSSYEDVPSMISIENQEKVKKESERQKLSLVEQNVGKYFSSELEGIISITKVKDGYVHVSVHDDEKGRVIKKYTIENAARNIKEGFWKSIGNPDITDLKLAVGQTYKYTTQPSSEHEKRRLTKVNDDGTLEYIANGKTKRSTVAAFAHDIRAGKIEFEPQNEESLSSAYSSQIQPQENASQFSGWDSLLKPLGFDGMGDVIHNLPYVLATLPDMIIGLFTGKAHSVKLKKDILPLASIAIGVFVKNPLLKTLLVGGGGLNLVNKLGKESLEEASDKYGGTQKEKTTTQNIREYGNEELSPRLKDPTICGNRFTVILDNVPRFAVLPEITIKAYNEGKLPLNTLANRMLKVFDNQVAKGYYDDVSSNTTQSIIVEEAQRAGTSIHR